MAKMFNPSTQPQPMIFCLNVCEIQMQIYAFNLTNVLPVYTMYISINRNYLCNIGNKFLLYQTEVKLNNSVL